MQFSANAVVNVVFVNGIDGSAQKSQKSVAKLHEIINAAGLGSKFQTNDEGIYYFMNTADGPIDDKVELLKQATISAAALTTTRNAIPNATADSSLYKAVLGQYYTTAINNGLGDIEEDRHIYSMVKKLADDIKILLADGRKVIVVAHSQGNFFIEATDAYLRYGRTIAENKIYDDNLRFVGAASVAASSPNGRYLSAEEDQALSLHRIATLGIIPFTVQSPNVRLCNNFILRGTCDLLLRFIDITIHGFLEIYTSSEVDKNSGKTLADILVGFINASFDELVAPPPVPTVTNVTPVTATLNTATVFTVTGTNLPLTAILDVAGAICQNPGSYIVVGVMATGFSQTCTSTTTGIKTITVKTAPGGTVIDNTRTVNVAAAPVAGNIDLPSTSYLRATNVALSTSGQYGADALLNAPPYNDVPNAAEWDFNVPVTGSYQLLATYASGESRPSQISFNGTQVFANAIGTTTGGFFPANRQTLLQGIVQLTAGANTMRVSRSSAFTHIKGFSLVFVNSGVGLLNPANGHRYEVITCGAWIQCDAAARAKGGNLVTIRNSAENTWLLANIFNPSSNVMFIGLFKTGSTWSWSSGEPIAFTAWLPGNPDNYLGNQNYVHLSSGNLLWDDVADAFYGAATQAIVEYIPQSSTFSVPANLSSGTQFTVPAGATSCTFNASGTWINATNTYTAAGDINTMPLQWPSYYTWPMSTSPFFSLIALKSGTPFYIENQATLSVISGQSLSFVANDSYYSNSFSDNSGALSVSYSCS